MLGHLRGCALVPWCYGAMVWCHGAMVCHRTPLEIRLIQGWGSYYTLYYCMHYSTQDCGLLCHRSKACTVHCASFAVWAVQLVRVVSTQGWHVVLQLECCVKRVELECCVSCGYRCVCCEKDMEWLCAGYGIAGTEVLCCGGIWGSCCCIWGCVV